MSSNEFQITEKFLKKAMLLMGDMGTPLRLLAGANRGKSQGLTKEFKVKKYAPGKIIQMKHYLDVRKGTEGLLLGDIPPMEEAYISIKVEGPLNQSLAYNTDEMDYEIGAQYFMEQFMIPNIKKLTYRFNRKIAERAATTLYDYVGSPTSDISDVEIFGKLDTRFTRLGEDGMKNRIVALSPEQYANVVNIESVQNQFLPAFNKNLTIEGNVRRLRGYDIYSDNDIYIHETYPGNRDGITVKSTIIDKATSFVLTGFTPDIPDIVVAGDPITFTNVYKVDRRNKVAYGAEYSVSALINASSNGDGDVTITVAHPIRTNQESAYRETDRVIASGTGVTFMGNHTVNIAYVQEDGLIAFTPPLSKVNISNYKSARDRNTGLIINYMEGGSLHDRGNTNRLDMGYGIYWEYLRAIKVISKPSIPLLPPPAT